MTDAISTDLTCEPKLHIYVVVYRLLIDKGKEIIYCDETVRCIATDAFLAMSLVHVWAENTTVIWCKDGDEYTVPIGRRDVTIMSVELNVEDIGEALKQCPLPNVFQY
jgi:hypothetical protein